MPSVELARAWPIDLDALIDECDSRHHNRKLSVPAYTIQTGRYRIYLNRAQTAETAPSFALRTNITEEILARRDIRSIVAVNSFVNDKMLFLRLACRGIWRLKWHVQTLTVIRVFRVVSSRTASQRIVQNVKQVPKGKRQQTKRQKSSWRIAVTAEEKALNDR